MLDLALSTIPCIVGANKYATTMHSWKQPENVAKEMKICAWLAELSDKGMCLFLALLAKVLIFSEKHRSTPVLVHEELWRQP